MLGVFGLLLNLVGLGGAPCDEGAGASVFVTRRRATKEPSTAAFCLGVGVRVVRILV